MPSRRLAPAVVAAALLAGSLALFTVGIDRRALAPAEAALLGDAAAFVNQGARDLDQRRWPLFPRTEHGRRTPLPFYVVVLTEPWWRDDPARARYLAALTGASAVPLTYLAASPIVSHGLAVLAALLVATTPAFVAHSRMIVGEGVWAVPFVMAFVAAASRWLVIAPRSARYLAAAAAVLIAAAYAQPSGALIAVCIGAASGLVIGAEAPARRDIGAMAMAVAVVLAPAAVTVLVTPSVYGDTFGAWLLHQAHVRNPLEWARSFTNHNAMRQTADAFWDFFSPAHLLFGDRAPAVAGFFLLASGGLAIFGTREVVRRAPAQVAVQRVWWLILAALVAAVFATALFREERATARGLVIAPLAMLLAVGGVAALGRTRAGQLGLALAAALGVVQFGLWFWHEIR